MTDLVVQAGLASRDLDLELSVPSGAVTAVVGPNGAGKTTLLHLVAGLVRPESGHVAIGGREVATPTSYVPVHRRRVALLTQRPALFPHLDVRENVAFGPRAAGADRTTARVRAEAELEAVGCLDLAARRPDQLSGGQAQRVAIARALATDPDVVLLDEPLAGLDIAVAAEVRHTLAARLRGRTALLVTHEALDIWTIADRLAVVEGGRVECEGAAIDLLTRPRTPFLARLCGTNLVPGVALADGGLEIAPGVVLRGVPDEEPLVPGRAGLASILPEAVALHLSDPGGSPRNALSATVTAIEPRGQAVRVHLDLASHPLTADLTPQAVAELGLAPGSPVRASVKATQVRLYGR